MADCCKRPNVLQMVQLLILVAWKHSYLAECHTSMDSIDSAASLLFTSPIMNYRLTPSTHVFSLTAEAMTHLC